MDIKFMGKPGDSIEFDNGAEIFRLACPVPTFRFYIPNVRTSLDFIMRSDIGRLELTGLAIYPNWRAAAAARKGDAVRVHCTSWGVTRAEYDQGILELSDMDVLNTCCLALSIYPEWSDAAHARWQRLLFEDAGNDAHEALRTAMTAIHWPNQRNPELLARLRNIVDHYFANVAGYRAAAR